MSSLIPVISRILAPLISSCVTTRNRSASLSCCFLIFKMARQSLLQMQDTSRPPVCSVHLAVWVSNSPLTLLLHPSLPGPCQSSLLNNGSDSQCTCLTSLSSNRGPSSKTQEKDRLVNYGLQTTVAANSRLSRDISEQEPGGWWSLRSTRWQYFTFNDNVLLHRTKDGVGALGFRENFLIFVPVQFYPWDREDWIKVFAVWVNLFSSYFVLSNF